MAELHVTGALKRNPTLSRALRSARDGWRRALLRFSPTLFARYRYWFATKKWLNLRHPRTFSEKLLWLMLRWRDPLKTRCGDKYGLRSYARERGLERLLPELVGVYRRSQDIDFGALPDRFVLKCTHGCGFNILCPDKSRFDEKAAGRQLDEWLKTDFSRIYGELHYAEMTPLIICEKFLGDDRGGRPRDFKLFCFDGKVNCTMVCTDRAPDGIHATYHYYDRAWSTRLPYDRTSLGDASDIPKPESYEEMVEAAERLSEPFPFVRVDFYDVKGRAVIGEMTFTPAGCIDPDSTDLAQRVLGDLIKLPPARRD